MKKGSSDLKWIIILIVLLVVETTWLLSEMQVIKLPFISESKKQVGSIEAGYVIKAQHELKRRGPNSLVWEPTTEKDILFYQDSILTLSQSSARLYLNDRTELQLSENTLVTLEEPEDKRKSEIRLRFSKGDLKARNPSAQTTLFNDSWSVTLDKGSEVALSKEAGAYQFEVISGNATLKTATGTENLSESKIIKLQENNELKKIEKSKSLQWKEVKPVRVYTYEEKGLVDLDWDGEAQSLIVQKTGEEEKVQNLHSAQQRTNIDLPIGSYQVRLKDQNGVSTSRAIEVWKAPKIYLKKPLPRDRLTVGETHEFVWTAEPGIKGYTIKLEDDNHAVQSENADNNFKKIKIEEERNVKWKVEAIDDDDHRIPAFYESEIYFIDKPLPAPKINRPKANDGAKLQKWPLLRALFLPEVYAKGRDNNQKLEMLFDWEEVSKADFYIIEISSHPDFIKPEVIEKVKDTEFYWGGYKLKKYYWRVAAGNSHGKMGLFSEPTEVRVEDLLVQRQVQPKVVIAKVEDQKKKPSVEIDKKEDEKPKETETSSSTNTAPITIDENQISSSVWGIAWSPSCRLIQVKGEKNSQVKLAGASPVGLNLNFKTPQRGNTYYLIDVWYNQFEWKPKPANEYPFQQQMTVSDFRLYLTRGNKAKARHLGFVLYEAYSPERISEEAVSIKKEVLAGFYVGKIFEVSTLKQGQWGLSFALGKNIKEVEVQAKYKHYLSDVTDQWRYYWGLAGQASYQQNRSESGYGIHGSFLLGLDHL